MYICAACNQTFVFLNEEYYIHTTECTRKRIVRTNESIEKLRVKLIQQDSANAVNIKSIHDTHAQAICEIKKSYDSINSITLPQPPQPEPVAPVDFKEFRRQYVNIITSERIEHENKLKLLEKQLADQHTCHSIERDKIIAARDAAILRLREVGKSIAHYTEEIETLKNANTEFIRESIQNKELMVREFHRIDLENVHRIYELENEIKTYSKIKQQHSDQVNRIKLELNTAHNAELTALKVEYSGKLNHQLVQNKLLATEIAALDEKIHRLEEEAARCARLELENKKLLSDIEKWKKYLLTR